MIDKSSSDWCVTPSRSPPISPPFSPTNFTSRSVYATKVRTCSQARMVMKPP
jgi:hypothetical protein